MPAIIPTPEQQAVIDAARDSDSIIVDALAGAAKTSTLCLMAAKLPMVPTFCGAFNKAIAEEMAKRMPSHIQCSTMNAMGHRVWGASVGKRLNVDKDKGYKTISMIQDRLSPGERKVFGESFAALLRSFRLAKAAGYVPEKMRSMGRNLIEIDDLVELIYSQIDVEVDDQFLFYLDQALEHSIGEAYNGLIDFDDQIYMSTLFGGSYPRFPIVLIDEAQDLSPLNHETIEKMFAGRLIAVGDPNQAIYAFRGASHTSMPLLKQRFNMRTLTLSTSFRCPQAVIRNVHDWVPHMTWPTWAKEGAVVHLESWTTRDIPNGAAIICRANAPLFKTAVRLIQDGRGIKLIGNDIGAGLIKVMSKLGPGDLSGQELVQAINDWEKDSLKRAPKTRHDSIMDKAQCLLIFAEVSGSLDEAIAYARTIFQADGPIQLMTGHKSKGLEFPIVFHLDSWLIPSKWAKEAAEAGDTSKMTQEKNLRYVINTRAQEALYYINSQDFKDE